MAAEPDFRWFVGIDWATQRHDVNVADARGTVVAERVIEHTAAGLSAFVDWLTTLADGQLGDVAVAIETTRGAVVELLLERGAAVFSVNPKQLDRFRDRFSVAGAKDDRLDALVLQSALRTDRPLFRRLALGEASVLQVRELTRIDEELGEELVRLTNRLREQVYRMAPAWLTLCENAGEAWFWDLVAAAGTPAGAQRLRRARVEELLRRARVRRVTADRVLAVFAGPPLPVAAGTVEAASRHIAMLLPRLRLVREQQRQCERELEALLTTLATPPSRPSAPPSGADATGSDGDASAGPPVVAILQSMPGIGVKITGTLVAHALPLLLTADLAALRASAGTAPVTRRSGKQRTGLVHMRYGCSRPLRNAVYHWAQCSVREKSGDAGARRYYAQLRARGHSHARALRSVGDRWLRILTATLRSQTLYDATRFMTTAAVN